MSSQASWHTFARRVNLSVSSTDSGLSSADLGASDGTVGGSEHMAVCRAAMVRNGYVKHERWMSPPPEALGGGGSSNYSDVLCRMCAALDLLEAAALPAQFLLMFDELWWVVRRLCAVLSPTYRVSLIHDFYIFHVKVSDRPID